MAERPCSSLKATRTLGVQKVDLVGVVGSGSTSFSPENAISMITKAWNFILRRNSIAGLSMISP